MWLAELYIYSIYKSEHNVKNEDPVKLEEGGLVVSAHIRLVRIIPVQFTTKKAKKAEKSKDKTLQTMKNAPS